MSEYTSIYLRKKDTPLLEYRDYPSYEETKCMPKDEYHALAKEIEDFNDKVSESFGCELFYLVTSDSRELDILPWSSNPKHLTNNLLDEILVFYDSKIEDLQDYIQSNKDKIPQLEARIVKANVELYDKISEEIDSCHKSIEYCQEEIEHYRYFRERFAFVRGILTNDNNAEKYELIYTKC